MENNKSKNEKGTETCKCHKCGDEYQILPDDKKPNPRICYQCREESDHSEELKNQE